MTCPPATSPRLADDRKDRWTSLHEVTPAPLPQGGEIRAANDHACSKKQRSTKPTTPRTRNKDTTPTVRRFLQDMVVPWREPRTHNHTQLLPLLDARLADQLDTSATTPGQPLMTVNRTVSEQSIELFRILRFFTGL